jgi:hypothetical protein
MRVFFAAFSINAAFYTPDIKNVYPQPGAFVDLYMKKILVGSWRECD